MTHPAWTLALLVLCAALLLHLLLAAGLRPVDDEAYDWVWAQHLDTGSFDHPLAVAWLIAGGSALPGEGRPDQYDLWALPQTPPDARALFVRPWRASTSTEIERAGFQRGGPHVVQAFADTPDPLRPVAVAAWQVYEVWR